MVAKLTSTDFWFSRRVFPLLVVVLSVGTGYALMGDQRWLALFAAAVGTALTVGWPAAMMVGWLSVASLGNFGPALPVPLSTVVVALLVGAWGLAVLVRKVRLGWAHLLLAGLMLWILFSFAIHPPAQPQLRSLGSERWNAWVLFLGLFLAGVAASIPVRLRSLLFATAAYGIFPALITVATWKAGRASALGLNPNFLGLMLALGFVTLLGLVVSLRRPAWLPALGLVSLALVRTGSRGALIAAAFGAAIILLAGQSRRRQVLVLGTVIAASLVIPMDAARTSLLADRSDTELAANSNVRQTAAEVATGYALSHPLTGLGYGNFPPYAMRNARLGIYINTHNDFLRLAAETGLPGLALFLGLFIPLVKNRKSFGAEQHVALGVVGVFAISLLFANALSNLQVSAPFWIILGWFWQGSRTQLSSPAPVRAPADTAGTLDLTDEADCRVR